MIITAELQVGDQTPISLIQTLQSIVTGVPGSGVFPALKGKCRYLSLQRLTTTAATVYIGNSGRINTTGDFSGRQLTADAPIFELSDFAGGNIPLDFWLIEGGGGGFGPNVLVTIIQDQD